VKNPSVEWFKGLTPEAKESFEKTLRNNTLLLDRLNDIVDDWEKEISRQETSSDDFSEPNWALRQAARNGDRRRLRRLKDLISFYKGP
jgi:hypothetical protein